MKKIKILIVLILVSSVFTSKAQQIGDGWAPVIPNFGEILQSGVYNGGKVLGGVPDNSYDGWQHLLVIRHPNSNNNHQFQLGTSLAENDRLFFRKIASGLTPRSPDWNELATRGSNSFVGDQNINGNVGIGGSEPSAKLNIFKTYDKINYKGLKMFYQGSWGTAEYASNFRFIDIASTEEGNIFQMNAYGIGIGFDPPSYASKDKLYINGNVGIGTSQPSAKLDIRTELPIVGSYDVQRWSTSHPDYNLRLQTTWSGAGINQSFIQKYNGVDYTSLSFHCGNVGVGTSMPDSKLTVKGTIHAEEVKVDLNIPAADYVFEPDYALMPLSELKQFVAENKHLPEVPSGKEMEANGINVSEMNMILLKKVEELTLHLIEQNKRSENQQMEIDALKQEMASLKK